MLWPPSEMVPAQFPWELLATMEFLTVPVLELSIPPPPPLPPLLPDSVLLVTVSVPELSIPPPKPLEEPWLTVNLSSERTPPEVAPTGNDTATSKIRKLGAPPSRVMVAPFPAIV